MFLRPPSLEDTVPIRCLFMEVDTLILCNNDDVVRDLEEKTLQAEARAEFAEKSVMKLQAEVRP